MRRRVTACRFSFGQSQTEIGLESQAQVSPPGKEERDRMLKVPRWSALVGVLAVTALAPAAASAQTAPNVPPVVTHTGTARRGYEVTFRYYTPTATAVSIKGGWSFTSLDNVAGDPTNASPISAANWKPGNFQLQS